MPKAGCDMRVMGGSSVLASAGPVPGQWDSWGKINNKKQTKTKLSFLSSSVPQNKRDSGRRWTGTVPAKSIMFLTLQGHSVIHGLPTVPRKGMSCLQQGVLLGFGSVLSLMFISVHPAVLICFPCSICCTQSCLIWAQGIFLLFSGLGLPSSCLPAWGFFTGSTPKTPSVLGRAHLGRWGGCRGGWGCPGCPSQVMSCCFQAAEYPNTHRLLYLGAFGEFLLSFLEL